MKTILFVCTGNTCRSPMAMAIFNDMAQKQGLDGYCADSAGLAASGAPVHPNSVKALEKIDIKISDYRSKNLTPALIDAADRIIVMTAEQKMMLEQVGVPSTRISVLGDGIPDPFGGDEEAYINCMVQIQSGIERLMNEELEP